MNPQDHKPAQPPAIRPRGFIGPMRLSSNSGRVRNNLMALSSLAVLAVYSAGYLRTQSAAKQFDTDAGRKTRMNPQTTGPAVEPVGRVTPLTPKPTVPEKPALATSTPELPKPELSTATTPPVAPEVPPTPSPAVAVTPPTTTPVAATPAPSVTPPTAPEPAPVVATTTQAPAVPASTAPVAAVVSPPPAVTESAKAALVADNESLTSESPALIADAKPSKWKDGKYSGWGSCRHGDIEATVEIRAGRIVSAVVSKCRTVYSCNVIDKVIPQVVQRQSPDVDSVSGATQSADSFYWAVYSALQDAEIKPATKPK